MTDAPRDLTDEEAVANIICHYVHPSDFNSCCSEPMGEKSCQVKARAVIAELRRLRAPSRKLMYDKGGEQLVWLVWEMAGQKPSLAVICTTDDDLARYVTPDKKSWRIGGAVHVEKVMADHLYGSNDMRIAASIMRNTGDP